MIFSAFILDGTKQFFHSGLDFIVANCKLLLVVAGSNPLLLLGSNHFLAFDKECSPHQRHFILDFFHGQLCQFLKNFHKLLTFHLKVAAWRHSLVGGLVGGCRRLILGGRLLAHGGGTGGRSSKFLLGCFDNFIHCRLLRRLGGGQGHVILDCCFRFRHFTRFHNQ